MVRLYGCAPLLLLLLLHPSVSNAQSAAARTAAGELSEAEHALKLAGAGRCGEALPALEQAFRKLDDKLTKRKVGLAGVRCAMTLGQPAAASDFMTGLNRQFPHDPEVLYVLVHAYSDLSTLAAQELAQHAPSSSQALELNAEAFEQQGKWDQAAEEYRKVLAQNPNAPGIHFRIGRVLLSKPKPPADVAEQARQEMLAELRIDPGNAGAEYVLGELARQDQNWDQAVEHFSRVTKIDAGFGDAFLGLGQSLLAEKKFNDAISPLETAAKLEPANPAAHYSLGAAYSRVGRKAESDKEFAIHRELIQKDDAQRGAAESDPSTGPK